MFENDWGAMSEHGDLLEAVDRLTKPLHRKQLQTVMDPDGRVVGTKLITLSAAPLLEQLAEAIQSSIGGSSAGATLASERSLLDTDALQRFSIIDSQVRDWCRDLGLVPTRDPAANLRAWYVTCLTRRMTFEVEAFHLRTLSQWATLIDSKLDPVRERELDDRCPECEATTWWRDGSKYRHPLVVRYRPDGADMIQAARASCRACETSWGVRAPAWEIEQRKQHAA
ncbi:DUF7341 domain-containing protein [Naasia lichenicola]|uniref:DUF7341 domain-containing protein n=1 Tax=Naasia lichenicola TaxID=2565933 RepID=A0A4S4FQY4_9MICO|nr:hypothetical protein [Naasia lichenicola]THG32999.1 hypothetical protein E6C64_01140 [Naasia lichenicola]